MKKFQLVVIGAGSGGIAAAETAAKLGASVALIDSKNSLSSGRGIAASIPSKALIHAARSIYRARTESYGLEIQGEVDYAAIKSHIRDSVEQASQNSNEAALKKLGVTTLSGQAKFTNARTLKVGKDVIKAKRIIIATGSAPLLPPIDGLLEVPYYTNETIFEIDELPESLVVIGGGPQGVELGEAFAMLGSKVTILHENDRVLAREEPEASAALKDGLEQLGVKLVFGANIHKVSQAEDKVKLDYTGGDEATEITADALFVATGRKPNLDLDLDQAGVDSTKAGIQVNSYLATSQSHIYAIGDCNGGPQFDHVAATEANTAVRNALLPGKRTFDRTVLPWVSFTTPEIGHLGRTELEVKQSNYKYSVHTFDYSDLDKAITEQETGFIKIITEPNGAILGATVVGAEAGELIGQLSLLYFTDGRLSDLTLAVQPYPTYSHGLKQIAEVSALAPYRKGWRRSLLRVVMQFQR